MLLISSSYSNDYLSVVNKELKDRGIPDPQVEYLPSGKFICNEALIDHFNAYATTLSQLEEKPDDTWWKIGIFVVGLAVGKIL